MRNFTPALLKLVYATMFLGVAIHSNAQQQLNLTDFAVWGGSASSNTYNSSQGVFIGNTVAIQGNVGSNHRVTVNNLFSITGNVYSGNIAAFGNIGKVTGNIFAAKTASNYTGHVITGDYKLTFAGNLTAKGKINLKNLSGSNASFVTGQVAVPAPTSTNYVGPTPTGGFTNTLSFPILPTMPNSIKFDNQVGTKNITSTSTITPGKYKKLGLSGSKTITFSGPGNYIFENVDNGTSANKVIFDFKGTTTGTINIFVIKDAKWGRISVSTKNGNFPSRIYTEIHGTGSTNSGIAFDLTGPLSVPSGSNVWLGNVWAPNGAISVKSLSIFNAPHIIGALWSGKKVELDQNLKLVYQAPAIGTGPAFIDPVIAAPVNGKVAATVKVGAELTVLQSNPAPIISQPENDLFIIDNSTPATPRVLIEVISKDPNDATLRSQLVALGMRNADGAPGTIDNGPHIYTISGYFPISLLSQLNSNTRIEYVRPLYPPISNSGFVMTQGDGTMRSDVVRSRFGVDGSGVKIGVISDSYGNKADPQVDVNEGELPGPRTNETTPENPESVQVVQDLLRGGNDEGRAMLQIVHDVAPKAKLAFHTGFLSAGQFAKAIQTLASPSLAGGRCDVIVDDLTYITEPFQRDGVVAQSVNQAVASGVTYVSSAGNFGNKSYEGIFTGVTNTAIIPTGQIHRFGANATDIYQTVNLKPGNYTIGLQWSDEFSSLGSVTGVTTDLDMYIFDANGFQLFGFNRSNIFGDPFEICAFTVKQETNAKLMIVRASGLVNVRFKWVMFRGDGTIVDFQSPTPSSIVGHPNADSAIAVGAMLYANIPGVTPVWPGVASFSSRGGTFTRVNNGTNFIQRSKPELIAPNGVNTTVDLGGAQFNDGDTHPNFFGTSAAAPHVAGVAALIFQARKKYGLQATIKPYEIREQLVSSAGKFTTPAGSFSFEGGYGFVQADSAMQQTANARPIISRLENGNQPLQVKVEGKYLVSNTQISVNNILLPTSVSINASTGVGIATATIPANLENLNPAYRLYNPPKSPSGEDGGYSETLRFSGSKIKILVKADHKTRKYGQENQVLTSSVDVIIGEDTSDISLTSLTLTELKLDNLVLFTNATAFSLPRTYGISIARSTPLEEDDPLLEEYDFEFRAGNMTVEKMPLTITAFGPIVKYGDDINNISYSYELNQQAEVSPLLLEEVKSLHRKYIADNGLIVLSDYYAEHPAVSLLDFFNMSAMASFQSVQNARKFIAIDGQLKPLSSATISQIGDQRFIVDASAKSLVKYKQDSVEAVMETSLVNEHKRAFLNVKALTTGDAKASVSGEAHTSMVNGQLMAMVNGQLKALVNGQLKALVNGVLSDVRDLTFQNNQLLVMDGNNIWTPVTSAQLIVTLEGQQITVDMAVSNGQLTAVANGQPMTLEGGELQAIINGQQISLVNGQLKALVNGQVTPLVNGELTAIVNGQLKALVNGQLRAIVNGQLLAEIDGEYETVQDIIILEDEMQVVVNGQLRAIVNGQLKALVNGAIENVPTTSVTLLNGQLRAVVNGQTVAYVNGQLRAVVNGQLKALVNGTGLLADGIVQVNGQLKALVNGLRLPVANGQLEAMVNGQLFSMVDGQLMSVDNEGTVNFIVFQNGQLKALVNGQFEDFEPVVNGQLKAIVNGQFEDVEGTPEVLPNGQLRAVVNGETWVFPNGQLKALVNGQLRPLVNNFDVRGANNNAKTLVLVDEDDVNLQSGDLGGMFAMNMITSLEAGIQVLIPAAFVNENFEVTYKPSNIIITEKPLYVSVDNATKASGQSNPPFNITYDGFAYSDNPSAICHEVKIPETTVDIDQLERRTTYTNVKINGGSNSYIAQPGESLTLTGNWLMTHFANIDPQYAVFCPGCITQNYLGMANSEYSANQFDVCYDVTGTGIVPGSINSTFTAPTRPGVYYITQQSSWYFSCYQFGHLLHTQNANEAIAVVIVAPADGITAQTTATQSSLPGEYPITINGCYFPNYRVIFKDGTLTVGPGVEETFSMLDPAETVRRQTKLYPNPASDIVRLELEHDVQSVNDIKIYDGMGRLQAAMSRKQGEGYYEINISGLKPGIYLINARTAVGVKTFKFMKM